MHVKRWHVSLASLLRVHECSLTRQQYIFAYFRPVKATGSLAADATTMNPLEKVLLIALLLTFLIITALTLVAAIQQSHLQRILAERPKFNASNLDQDPLATPTHDSAKGWKARRSANIAKVREEWASVKHKMYRRLKTADEMYDASTDSEADRIEAEWGMFQ
ncbi:hypothetical protein AC578_8133 [Pseudocercospora eumusae]|uniref:Uncharacterized protein n=1 Tax=Pseudocercospora eumusae TaxID=321146 RepID=A0A139HAD3_9PEZI|nr:hypothetical protein AC578_8133 [Pseudocercospora eumusae]